MQDAEIYRLKTQFQCNLICYDSKLAIIALVPLPVRQASFGQKAV